MSVLQTANVHFNSDGSSRIGKDGATIVMRGNPVNVDNVVTATSVTVSSGVQFSTNAITNYTVSTSAPTGGNDGDVWVVIT